MSGDDAANFPARARRRLFLLHRWLRFLGRLGLFLLGFLFFGLFFFGLFLLGFLDRGLVFLGRFRFLFFRFVFLGRVLRFARRRGAGRLVCGGLGDGHGLPGLVGHVAGGKGLDQGDGATDDQEQQEGDGRQAAQPGSLFSVERQAQEQSGIFLAVAVGGFVVDVADRHGGGGLAIGDGLAA